MSDDCAQIKTFINLQLLQIVSGANDGGNRGSSNYTYFSKHRRDKSTSATYSRMFLFREIDSNMGQVVYMIEGRSLNERLWIQNPQLHDNGMITIGTSLSILNPIPIQNQLGNEIPILESQTSGIVLCPPQSYHPVQIDESLPQNVTCSFVLNNLCLSNVSMTVEVTQCSGLFCDRQRVLEIMRSNKGCGCYSMQT